jgi:chromate transport protein ChrA
LKKPAVKLCFSFLRLGLTAFGGPAMIALVRKEDMLYVVAMDAIFSLLVLQPDVKKSRPNCDVYADD